MASFMEDRPTTRHAMRGAGYEFIKASTCTSCEAPIEWWLTKNKKRMPVDPPPTGSFQPDLISMTCHFETCAKRRNAPAATSGTPPTSALTTAVINRRRENVVRHRDNGNARVVLAIYDDGFSWAWRKGDDAENLRQNVIDAANQIRRDMEAQHG